MIASGWEAYNSDQAPRYRKQGCIVQLVGAVKPTAETASDTWQTVGTLPNGYRPAYATYAVCQGSAAYRLAVQINPNGNVMVGRYGTTSATSFVTTSWVRLDAVFMV